MKRALAAGLCGVAVLIQGLAAPACRIRTVPYLHRPEEVSALRRALEGHLLQPAPAMSWAWVVVGLALLGLAWKLSRRAPKSACGAMVAPPKFASRGLWPVGLALWLAWTGLYSGMGLRLAEARAFRYTDVLFQNDTPRVIDNMSVQTARQRRTQVHPLFVLLTNPVGWQLLQATGSRFKAAVLLNAGIAALGVVVVFFLLLPDLVAALLVSGLLGFSTSHFFFGAIPHTGALATLALALSLFTFERSLRQSRPWMPAWLACGLLSFGVTLTNAVPCALLLGVAVWSSEGWRRAFGRMLTLGLGVLILGSALALLQKAMYPTTSLFFLPESFRGEAHSNVSMVVLGQPFTVLAQLVKHFFLVNMVSPLPSIYPEPRFPFPSLTLVSSWNFGPLGWLSLGAWLAALSLSLPGTLRLARSRDAWTLGLLACLAFHGALHCFYGVGEKGRIELLQYTNHWTLLVLLLVLPTLRRHPYALGLGVFWLGINNAWVLESIAELYRGP